MCLLSWKPANVRWNHVHLTEALKTNKDGFGFVSLIKGKIVTSKGTNVGELLAALDLHNEHTSIFHARWATHGTKTVDQLHPYKVVGDVWMAHNGVFSIATPDATKSDTWHMARRLGSLGEAKLVAAIQNPEWMKEYEKIIGSNKVSFIHPSFGIITANENLGHVVEGVWMSNNSYKPSTWDRGGVTTYYPAKNTHQPSSLLQPVDILESWIDDKHPWSLILEDMKTEPYKTASAVQILVDRIRMYEQFELERPFGDALTQQAIV